jgi:hypothetical protein
MRRLIRKFSQGDYVSRTKYNYGAPDLKGSEISIAYNFTTTIDIKNLW